MPRTVAVGTCVARWAATAPAPVHRSTARPCLGEQRAGAAGKFLALDPRDVDPTVQLERLAAEFQCPRDPGQGFSVLAPPKPGVERVQVGRGGEELVGLLFGRDASGGDEAVDHAGGGGA